MELDSSVWGTVFPELARASAAPPQPILGFRINRVELVRRWWGKPSLVLRSVGASDYTWEPGRNEARCLLFRAGRGSEPRHQAPASGCHCGLYASHDLDVLTSPGLVPDLSVLAGVAGSGTVRIHAHGWRAQYARIIAFSLELPPRPEPMFGGGPWPHLSRRQAQILRATLDGRLSLREAQFLRLISERRADLREKKVSNRLSPVVVRALEDKYQVPVVPLQDLKETMAKSGGFWEEAR